MQLTPEQQVAVDSFDDVYRGRVRRRSIGGHAGTGKTTVIQAITERYSDVLCCAPTGKAAHVLRSKGVDAVTLHSLIYIPRGTDAEGNVLFASNKRRDMPRCVIVDEASMLSRRLVNDLEKKVKHVLYVGDHGQLEPIDDQQDRRDPWLGVMHSPDIRLEQIHRQVADSPIIQFAHHVRSGNRPRTFGEDALVQRGMSDDLADFDVVLVGFNDSRRRANAWIRERRGYSGKLPEVGESIICKRNDKEAQVWNGMMGIVTEIDNETERLSVDTDDGPRDDLLFNPLQFGALKTLPYERPDGWAAPTLWDFGYALTVHSGQGSEWDRVAVVEEISSSWSAERWRYTAATRAKQQLRWVLPS
jgi:exodeoxyribonuclease-5